MEKRTRKNIRLKTYDYSSNGAYFITIGTYNRSLIFGDIENSIMMLSDLGRIAFDEIGVTQKLRCDKGIAIEKFVIMPNHVHMIVTIANKTINKYECNEFSKPVKNSISMIVGAYKAAVTRKINAETQWKQVIWQPKFHEHIIRGQLEYDMICEYIEKNPQRWKEDCYN